MRVSEYLEVIFNAVLCQRKDFKTAFKGIAPSRVGSL